MTLVGFLRLKWLLMRLRRINFPVPVMWMRAFAPLCVLSFGICWFFYLLIRLIRSFGLFCSFWFLCRSLTLRGGSFRFLIGSFDLLVSFFRFLILSFRRLTGGFRFLVGPLRFLRRGQKNHR